MCAASGNFELNAFMPLIAESLLDSPDLLNNLYYGYFELMGVCSNFFSLFFGEVGCRLF